ncbi:META domain-containing protein [Hwangdonia lutea]|uniref:META domain-containing protein n=1 Tax=Hwangdonia lutea TaxID=3075823 RepID=A0AA97EQ95_9FLAO|nr:META domain-containing protein [Hwangdonia sp. SCSIO 19198]WOD44569.1 META domain-containing protein [Hwangdonia sp. SCSIO 19198]
MKTKLTTVALLAVTILSCNNGKKSNSENPEKATDATNTIENVSIENIKWVITTLEGDAINNPESNGEEIYFILDSETNRVNGYSGCNTFMGTYTIEKGNRISFSQLASTRKMCPDSKINESQILSIFDTADNFTISGNKLALNKAKRAPLAEFKKAESTNEPIVEKYWKIKTLDGKEVTLAENQEREIFFTLKTQDNKVTGFAGCNTVSGEYTLEKGNRIRFKNMATTLKACPDVAVNEAEFLKIFELADNYTVNNDVLSLNVGKRAPLAVFEAVYFK